MLLANHGPVVSAASLDKAVYAIEELEETAKARQAAAAEGYAHVRERVDQQLDALLPALNAAVQEINAATAKTRGMAAGDSAARWQSTGQLEFTRLQAVAHQLVTADMDHAR